MDDRKCPECNSDELIEGLLSASMGLTFIPDDEKGFIKKSSLVSALACRKCGAVFGLRLKNKPDKLTD
ncbi:MAG: PF20097 family protein [Lachnospiraceae bacterium]|nr:PF20097 family protein [Lachnospiraceae bacterium]